MKLFEGWIVRCLCFGCTSRSPPLSHHAGGALSVGLERSHGGDAEENEHEDGGELRHLGFCVS